MDDDLDLGEAADYIMAQRPRIPEERVWAVLNELQHPPAEDAIAMALLASVRPDVPPRHVRAILWEWRGYARLAHEPDWEDD